MIVLKWVLTLCILLACGSRAAGAASLLGTELASFSVLASATVTNTGNTVLSGGLGVFPGTSITGQSTITVNGTNANTANNPYVHAADLTAAFGLAQLYVAMSKLDQMGPGTTLPANLTGMVLAPGVYTVAAGATNLTGTLTLDGGGNANAYWVFQMPSTLITSSGAIVKVINTGAGAGVYWNVGSSATLGSGSTFAGNILATASVTMNTGVTVSCGRVLALGAAVTMIADTVNATDCVGTGQQGSNGLSGGLSVSGIFAPPAPLPYSPVSSACSSFLLNIPNHVAETSQSFTVSTVTSDTGAACISSLAGTTKTVTFSCNYQNPASGTVPVRMGADVALAASTTSACSAMGSALSLTFNAAGVANASLIYADVGQMKLTVSYTPGTGTAFSGARIFIVAPAKFSFSAISQTAAPGAVNPAAADDQGAKFIKAGEAFSGTITALNTLNNPTANFGKEAQPEQLTLAATLLAPAGGNLPAPAGNFGAFSAGVASASNLAWSEVGIVALNASLANGYGYLGTIAAPSNLRVSGSSGNIGRFVPDHFDTAINAGIPMPCPAELSCPSAGFVYSRQAFGVTTTARNVAGATTQNYSGLFAHAVTLDAWNGQGNIVLHNPPAAPVGSLLSNPGVAAASFVQGTASVTAPAYAFPTAYPNIVNLAAPTSIYLRARDTDGVTSLRGAASVEGGVTVVSGRLQIANNYGLEMLMLPVSVQAQYWTGSRFTISSGDNQSTFSRSNVVFGNCTNNLSTGSACKAAVAVVATPASYTLVNGTSTFKLNASGSGNTGTVDLSINAFPYLPSMTARLALGFYKSGPVIYSREVY